MQRAPKEQALLVGPTLEALLAKSAGRLDGAARAERLKAAALMECAERGYRQVTVAHIAKRARVSTATIYAEYADRDALLVSAMEMLFGILANDVIETPQAEDPLDRVEQLLLAHGRVYAEPLTTWLFRLHVILAWSGYPHLHQTGRMVFQGIDAFWAGFLNDLSAQGFLAPMDVRIVVPLLLGPIERCTIISQLACGHNDGGRPQLADVARYGAQSLFQVFAGPAYRGPRRSGGAARGLAKERLPRVAAPSASSVAERLEAALAAAREASSPAARKGRILLAAAVECQERGYSAASMVEVAARAGVSTATIYRHFSDKPTLFAAALEQEMRRQVRPVWHADTAASPLAATAAGVAQYAAQEADPTGVWIPNITMASELSGSAPIVSLAQDRRARIEGPLAEHLADLARAGVLEACDPALAVNALLGGVERAGVLSLILFGKDGVDQAFLEELADAAAQLLFLRHG